MSTDKHAVLYTDGGFLEKARLGGWGVHGYTYTHDAPKKGTGNGQIIATAGGYVPTHDKADKVPVTIQQYIDGVGTVYDAGSSNHTELNAALKALEWATESEIQSVKIISDSQYVVKGTQQYLDKWKNTGWVNSTGKPVQYRQDWERMHELKSMLENQGKSLSLQWVKGHNGDFGNELVDGYAGTGNLLGLRGSTYTYLKESDAAGYWNPKADFNKLLGSGKWYFSTTDTDYRGENHTVYYIGDHGKDDEHYGKPSANASMSVIYVPTPDPVLETLREHAMALDSRRAGCVMIANLSSIMVPKQYSQLVEHGVELLHWDDRRKDIMTSDRTRKLLVKEQNPPGLAFMAIEVINHLQRKLDCFLDDQDGLVVTEVTSHFYAGEGKKCKLHSEITQSTAYIDLMVGYDLSKRSEASLPHEYTLRLRLGMDLPTRNMLAHIAAPEARVYVVTWRESPVAFRYATVIQSKLGTGIWAATTSNFTYVSNEESP